MSSGTPQTVKVTVNGNAYLIEVEDLHSSPLRVKVNGTTYTVEVESSGIADVSAPSPVTVSEPAPRPVSSPEKASTSPVSFDKKEVTAPLPGNITQVMVDPGQRVSVGQALCSLEAMKMNNVIRSPREGVIAGVTATPGQTVNHGDVLITFE